jgi:hypothetical protein
MLNKKTIIGALVLFVGYWMFQDPAGLAQLTKDGIGQVFSLTGDLFTALINFTKEAA